MTTTYRPAHFTSRLGWDFDEDGWARDIYNVTCVNEDGMGDPHEVFATAGPEDAATDPAFVTCGDCGCEVRL